MTLKVNRVLEIVEMHCMCVQNLVVLSAAFPELSTMY